MTWRSWFFAPLGVDPVRAAGLFGLVAGMGSLIAPYWTGLAEALGAIAAVGWAVRCRDDPRPPWVRWAPPAAAFAAVVGVVLAGSAAAALRGAAFGAAAALLAWTARRPERFGEVTT
jgi:hypothetical protein